MENIKKNYKRVILLLFIALVYIVGLYTYFMFFDDLFTDSSDEAFFVGLFGGLFIIGAFFIFGMIYIFAILFILSFVFATIARCVHNGENSKLRLYRGLMITAYVFLSLLALSMILCSAFMNNILGFVVAIVYMVFLIKNMIVTFKANVVEMPTNFAYYNSNMYYGQGINYNNQVFNNSSYNNSSYNNTNY